MKRRGISIICLLAFLLPAAAWAQQKGTIELKSIAQIEVTTMNAKGKKEVKRVDAAKAKVVPGDTVILTTTYTNIGKKPATNVVITNPVPAHMVYVDHTAEGKGTRIEFSVDGGKTYAAPGKLTVKDEQGKVRKAGAADYTHIKWTRLTALPPGGKGAVSFRGKVR